MRGTLLNTATVAGGAALGLVAGRYVSEEYRSVALSGLALVTFGVGVRMFLKTHNALVPAISVAIGGIVGLAIGIHSGIDAFATWARSHLPGDMSKFNEGLITSFVLFCVGPLTLLGCIEDGLEGKSELLALKSTMDGIAAFFLAASFGAGVLVTAGLLLLFQGALTLLAKKLSFLTREEVMLDELTAAGGPILMAIGVGVLGLKDLHTANYLPALFIAPFIAMAFTKFEGRVTKRA